MADDVGLVVAALIHGRAAHEGEVRRKALLFEDGPHNVGGLAGGRAEGQARSLETAQHLHHAGIDIALVAAPGGVAHAVALRGLLDFCRVGEMLAEALAEGRADVAAKVAPGDVNAHGAENFFQCIENAGGGIDERTVHVKQDRIVVQQGQVPLSLWINII